MTIEAATSIAQSPAVWAICTIILVGMSLNYLFKKNEQHEQHTMALQKEYRDESKDREKELLEHLKRSNDSQEAIVKTIERLDEKFEQKLGQIDQRVEKIEKKLF